MSANTFSQGGTSGAFTGEPQKKEDSLGSDDSISAGLSSERGDVTVYEDRDDLPVIRAASKDDFLRSYISFANKMPYLTDQEELDLVRRANSGDERAVEDLVKSHLRLVVKIALGYYRYGLPAMDLISEGNLGLVTAVRKFDPKKGNRLSTYAMWWIKAMIQGFILKSWSVVKIASTVAERNLFFSLQKIKQRLNISKDSGLSDDDAKAIAQIANADVKSVKRMDLRLLSGDKSMDAPVDLGDGTVPFGDTVSSDLLSPEQELVAVDDRRAFMKSFNKAMSGLSERERQFVLYRISKEMKDSSSTSYTLKEIGEEYGISGERVRQITDNAMDKLRAAIVEDGAY